MDKERINFSISEDEFMEKVVIPLTEKREDGRSNLGTLIEKNPMMFLLVPLIAHDVWENLVEFSKASQANDHAVKNSVFTDNPLDVFRTGRE